MSSKLFFKPTKIIDRRLGLMPIEIDFFILVAELAVSVSIQGHVTTVSLEVGPVNPVFKRFFLFRHRSVGVKILLNVS